MLTPSSFDEQAAALAAANGIIPIEVALNYQALIGDTPELDDQGKLVVRDGNGVELARLTAPPEGSSILIL